MKIRRAEVKDAEGIAQVQVDSWRTTYRGLVPDDYLASLSYDVRRQRWTELIPQVAVYVAETEAGKIIGFASGGKERSGNYPDYEGELSAIYLLQEHQGQGTGKELLMAIVEEIRAAGMDSMLVFVLDGNPARRFYEALDGERIGEIEDVIGTQKVKEHIYGWKSLQELR